MSETNKYFAYTETLNENQAINLLEKRGINFEKYEAIQGGITEFQFNCSKDEFYSIVSEVLSNHSKVHLSEGRLPISGSIGTINATITTNDIKVGSTDQTSGNARYIKTVSDGTIVLPSLPAGSNNIGKVDILTLPNITLNINNRTPTHSSVQVGTTSTTVLNSNPNRKAVLLVNDSDETIYIKIGQTALLNEGIRINSNGGNFLICNNEDTLNTGTINAISSSGNKKLLITEWV